MTLSRDSGLSLGSGLKGLGGVSNAGVSAPTGDDLILDGFSNIHAAYSLRKLRTDYTGFAVKIRESGSDADLDVGFDADGNFDVDAAATHIGGNSGFIDTWYDQSGNGRNQTQATDTNQPLFVTSQFNSRPIIRFNGSDEFLFRVTSSDDLYSQNTSHAFTFVWKIL